MGTDEHDYLIPKAEWDKNPPWLQNVPVPWYGEINSAGLDAASQALRALVDMVDR